MRTPKDPAPRAERASLLVGLLLLGLVLALVVVLALLAPPLARGLAVQMGAHAALGKETGIPAGLAGGVPPLLVLLVVFIQDAAVLLVGYPLVMRLTRGGLRWTGLRPTQPRKAWRGLSGKTEAVGITLLAASIWVPFLPTGALVAALVGHAAGYRPRLFLPLLSLSILLASIAYTTIYAYALEGARDTRLLWALAALAALVSLLVAYLARRKDDRDGPAS